MLGRKENACSVMEGQDAICYSYACLGERVFIPMEGEEGLFIAWGK